MEVQVQTTVKDYETYILLMSKSRLKSSISTSTLMAGFALIALVEINIAEEAPIAILIPFSTLTALLIFVHLLSLIIATRILPEIVAYIENPRLNVPQPLTHGHYWPVQMVWYLSNIIGVLLFLVELVLVAFVKFYPKVVIAATQPPTTATPTTTTPTTATTTAPDFKDRVFVGTATLSVVFTLLLIFLPFIAIFFRSLSRQKIMYQEEKMEAERAHSLLDSLNYSCSLTDSNMSY